VKCKHVDTRAVEAELGPEKVAIARGQAVETVRLTREVFAEVRRSWVMSAKYGPMPLPIWQDDDTSDGAPLPPGATPYCWQLYWFGFPGTAWPSEAACSHPYVVMRQDSAMFRAVVWAADDKKIAEEILALVIGRTVTLPEQKGASS
jgi:hypothetical protein